MHAVNAPHPRRPQCPRTLLCSHQSTLSPALDLFGWPTFHSRSVVSKTQLRDASSTYLARRVVPFVSRPSLSLNRFALLPWVSNYVIYTRPYLRYYIKRVASNCEREVVRPSHLHEGSFLVVQNLMLHMQVVRAARGVLIERDEERVSGPIDRNRMTSWN